jgi:hypothetical protein
MPQPHSLPPDRSDIPYKGKRVDMCSTASAHLATPPSGFASKDVSPTDSDWLAYRNMAVDLLFFGNRLMRNGIPLRARTLAVSAFDVDWQYGTVRPSIVRRPTGEVAAASDGWFFKNAPEAAIVVWQGDKRTRHVVASECRETPDLVDLDPDQDIHVQVNYAWEDILARRGSFGLWVKVID